MARMRQSRPGSGLGYQVEVPQTSCVLLGLRTVRVEMDPQSLGDVVSCNRFPETISTRTAAFSRGSGTGRNGFMECPSRVEIAS